MNRDRYRRSESETEESCVHTQRWRRRPHAESSERAQAIYVNDSSRGCRREARSLIFPAFCEHITWHSGDIFAQAASFARSHLLLSYQYLPVPFLSPDNDATSNPTSAPFLWRFCFSLSRSLSSLSLLPPTLYVHDCIRPFVQPTTGKRNADGYRARVKPLRCSDSFTLRGIISAGCRHTAAATALFVS